MTQTIEPPGPTLDEAPPAADPSAPPPTAPRPPERAGERPGDPAAPSPEPGPAPLTGGRVAVTALAWIVVAVVGVVLVLTVAGPLLEQRSQRALLAGYRADIRQASNEVYGLPGAEVATTADPVGAPVAILDISALGLRQVVVEGAAPQQTRRGPGHVVGTAGPGQPGNSAIVGRRSLFGAPFGTLSALDQGDQIVVSTTQGQSLYVVSHVERHRILDPEAEGGTPEAAAGPATNVSADEAAPEPGTLTDGPLTVDELYGPSDDDRLTLVTSAGSSPWATDEALVVVATMDGTPFAPTPQGGRTTDGDGRSGDPDARPALFLALAAFVAVAVGAVAAYRHLSWRSAYLMLAPPLVAATIVLAEQTSRTLPAWA